MALALKLIPSGRCNGFRLGCGMGQCLGNAWGPLDGVAGLSAGRRALVPGVVRRANIPPGRLLSAVAAELRASGISAAARVVAFEAVRRQVAIAGVARAVEVPSAPRDAAAAADLRAVSLTAAERHARVDALRRALAIRAARRAAISS
jgi:hypothetical protein